MLLIYCKKVTSRVKYTFKVVFKDVLGIDYQLTSNLDAFKCDRQDAKLVYGTEPLEGALFIEAQSLLFETKIKKQTLKVEPYKNTILFFRTAHKESLLPFDIFSATFYLVSRYEEYGKVQLDEHGRYLPEQSLAFQNDFLHQPVVNIWAKLLLDALLEQYPFLILDAYHAPKYRFYLSMDLDSSYAYKGKGILRTAIGLLNYLTQLKFKATWERLLVVLGYQNDPYDTYNYLKQQLKLHESKAIFFALVGNYGVYDKNLPYSSSHQQSLLKSLADEYPVGLHPSYQSNTSFQILKEESKRLESVLHRTTQRSRQHFLKLQLPHSYRNLIGLEITHDYSMGYPNQYGFRAGICTRYSFYDLELELETPLRIHPFVYMDGTFQQYLRKTPEESQLIIKQLIDEVKAVQGTFMCIWHNHSINNAGLWKDWQSVFETTLEYGKE